MNERALVVCPCCGNKIWVPMPTRGIARASDIEDGGPRNRIGMPLSLNAEQRKRWEAHRAAGGGNRFEEEEGK